MALFAAAAFFTGDHKAAATIATQALLALCITYAAARRDRPQQA